MFSRVAAAKRGAARAHAATTCLQNEAILAAHVRGRDDHDPPVRRADQAHAFIRHRSGEYRLWCPCGSERARADGAPPMTGRSLRSCGRAATKYQGALEASQQRFRVHRFARPPSFADSRCIACPECACAIQPGCVRGRGRTGPGTQPAAESGPEARDHADWLHQRAAATAAEAADGRRHIPGGRHRELNRAASPSRRSIPAAARRCPTSGAGRGAACRGSRGVRARRRRLRRVCPRSQGA